MDPSVRVKYLTLPNEFNFRDHTRVGPVYVTHKVKIIHSRGKLISCDTVNEHVGPRLYDYIDRTIFSTALDKQEDILKFVLQDNAKLNGNPELMRERNK